jgi:hypothetical protein
VAALEKFDAKLKMPMQHLLVITAFLLESRSFALITFNDGRTSSYGVMSSLSSRPLLLADLTVPNYSTYEYDLIVDAGRDAQVQVSTSKCG